MVKQPSLDIYIPFGLCLHTLYTYCLNVQKFNNTNVTKSAEMLLEKDQKKKRKFA